MRASNPFLKTAEIPYAEVGTTATVSGTIHRALFLIILVTLPVGYFWQNPSAISGGLILGAAVGGLALALITAFKPHLSPYTAPAYALVEGVVIGGVTILMEAQFPGIAADAAACTLAVLVVMLALYRFRIITVTDRLRSIIFAMTGAIALLYLASFLMGMFGLSMPVIHDAGMFGIGFSVIVIGVAAFNLLLDFDFIENAEAHGAPSYYEWYGAFGLLVTLVWLYLEIIRLLSKLRSR